MGYALAYAAKEQGAEVTLISATKRKIVYGVKTIFAPSAQEMYQKLKQYFSTCDIFISAAAVSDFRPLKISKQKIKKTSDKNITLTLTKNLDILAYLSRQKTHQYMVGFSAESEKLIANSLKKLSQKNLDMLIANNITRKNSGFAVDNNQVDIITPDKHIYKLPLLPKITVARKIITNIIKRLKNNYQ